MSPGIVLQSHGRTDPRYAALLAAIDVEWETLVPGFKSYQHKLSILVSPPRVQDCYHADVPGRTLWQVRGRKRIHVDPNVAPVDWGRRAGLPARTH